ncbi:YciI family protein [Arthrobacter sp. FW305-BF8]|uniref:YciI family protein n=1 Tax=Arthrobacter sp. FW305-BF8 TaxID=2879617 RepID=UPI001F470071|nr:YciI family protein [Arthrobacter sp. FW305-BF8]UKA53844.1 YciI family protein [Arthrobacter sp. FW305-BF8]
MGTFAVTYDYSAASTAGRDEHRPRHVEFLQKQFDDGRLVKSGPFGPEEDPGALLIIEADSKAAVEALMDQDPFYLNGLVAQRRIRQWNVFFDATTAANAGADAARR